MTQMLDLAKHTVAVVNENNIAITNMQLQKIMYFSIKKALQNPNFDQDVVKGIYDEPFLVWRYGPVVESVYDQYRKYGAAPIIENYSQIDRFDGLNQDILQLSRESVFKLVQKTHDEPFWRLNQDKIQGWRSHIEYPLDIVGAN